VDWLHITLGSGSMNNDIMWYNQLPEPL